MLTFFPRLIWVRFFSCTISLLPSFKQILNFQFECTERASFNDTSKWEILWLTKSTFEKWSTYLKTLWLSLKPDLSTLMVLPWVSQFFVISHSLTTRLPISQVFGKKIFLKWNKLSCWIKMEYLRGQLVPYSDKLIKENIALSTFCTELWFLLVFNNLSFLSTFVCHFQRGVGPGNQACA